MENLPIQKRERSKMASKWIIETPSPRERELPAPIGFSRERMALATAQAGQKVNQSKMKRNFRHKTASRRASSFATLQISRKFLKTKKLVFLRTKINLFFQNGPDQALLDKRNWDIALKNFKSLPMTLFMFYMIGDSINIMPILMIGGYLFRYAYSCQNG